MTQRTKTLAALVTLVAFSQVACYNSYFITKSELEKLESSVEPKEVVEVFGDCDPEAVALLEQPEAWAEVAQEADVASDAAESTPDPETQVPPGCALVEVSTVNALFIVMKDGSMQRVTPFNFIMSQGQVVSPEYNLLETLDNVDGAEVNEFSTWKTVGTVVGVAAVAVGTFVGISLAGGDSEGFRSE